MQDMIQTKPGGFVYSEEMKQKKIQHYTEQYFPSSRKLNRMTIDPQVAKCFADNKDLYLNQT